MTNNALMPTVLPLIWYGNTHARALKPTSYLFFHWKHIFHHFSKIFYLYLLLIWLILCLPISCIIWIWLEGNNANICTFPHSVAIVVPIWLSFPHFSKYYKRPFSMYAARVCGALNRCITTEIFFNGNGGLCPPPLLRAFFCLLLFLGHCIYFTLLRSLGIPWFEGKIWYVRHIFFRPLINTQCVLHTNMTG